MATTLDTHAATVSASPRTAPGDSLAVRALDIVGALVLLILFAPLMIVIAIAIRLDSPGSPVFRQRRLGRDLEPFTINKFRTMYAGADHAVHRSFAQSIVTGSAEPQEHQHGRLFKLNGDPRVTRVGSVLRRTSMDELPQLVNVLLGQMSLVGPRPALEYEVEKYPEDALPRFVVKPGLTGLWQVSGRCELTFGQMIELDVEYARKRSAWLNVRILLRTIPVVLLRKGAA